MVLRRLRLAVDEPYGGALPFVPKSRESGGVTLCSAKKGDGAGPKNRVAGSLGLVNAAACCRNLDPVGPQSASRSDRVGSVGLVQ